MGWSFGFATKEEIVERFRRPGFYPKDPIVKDALVGNHLWRLHQNADDPDLKWIGLTLIQGSRGNYGYKTISEMDFPAATNCPRSLLVASTEPRSDWREYCLLLQENAKLLKLLRESLCRPGLHVQSGPMTYELLENRGRLGWVVRDVSDGARYRMPAAQLSVLIERQQMAEARNHRADADLAALATPSWVNTGAAREDGSDWDGLPDATKQWWLNVSLRGAYSRHYQLAAQVNERAQREQWGELNWDEPAQPERPRAVA